MGPTAGRIAFRFGAFELGAPSGELRKFGSRIRLRPQAARVLLLLAARAGQIVTREELKKEIWGSETFVDFDQGLNLCIRQIRAALDDDADTPHYIETLPKRGYRFLAAVEELPTSSATLPEQKAEERQAVEDHPKASSSGMRRRWLVMLFAAVVMAAGALLAWRSSRAASPRIASIVVLPLENLSRDPEQQYFADGLTDELTTNLAKFRTLRVISRNSAMQYKGKHKPPQEIARELNVDALVEGTVMRSGERVRITAQLIAARSDTHLWAETYERDLRDILALQDEIARAIAEEISITTAPGEKVRSPNVRPVNPAAHEAYLRGLYELHGFAASPTETEQLQSIESAINYFQDAIAREPNDALAYAGLADAYSSLSTLYRAPLAVMPQAKAAALKAIQLDDTLAEAHASLGYLALTFDWDWPTAERELRRALELNPSSARAHGNYAQYLMFIRGRPDDSMREMQLAYDLDPLLPQAHGDMSWFLFLARRYSESVEAARRVGHSDETMALSYAEIGETKEALAAADRAIQYIHAPAVRSQIAAAYALAGRKDRARSMLGEITAQANQHYVCGFNVACVYSVLGETEEAFAWLERAYRDRSD